MPWWLWVLAGVIALAGEAISMALFLLNVGIAAFVAALLALTGADPVWQAVVFVALSVVLIGLVRPRLLRRLTGTPPRLLSEQETLAGRLATVTETVTEDGGEIRIGRGEFWTARPTQPLHEIAVGSRVRVDHVRGLTAYVEPLPATPLNSPTAPISPTIPVALSSSPASLATLDIQNGQPSTLEPFPVTPATPREGHGAPEAAMKAEQPHLFAELLKRHRQAAGLTQEELAERAHVSVRAVSSLERGVNLTPRRDTVELLAEALALSERDRMEFAEAARGRVPRG